ncbi:MAG TPA: sensor histidine kinase, partial [Marinilabiliales bacterium]|nr:sensor histidine kinase [Marinilabiliales bacterium]
YIFTRFRKFKAGKDSFGLGLALAKKICDYHGIEVQVSSVLGQGTTFELRIPKV